MVCRAGATGPAKRILLTCSRDHAQLLWLARLGDIPKAAARRGTTID
jgi:hypothetical protein